MVGLIAGLVLILSAQLCVVNVRANEQCRGISLNDTISAYDLPLVPVAGRILDYPLIEREKNESAPISQPLEPPSALIISPGSLPADQSVTSVLS
jgi:hypothetical protein